MVDHRISGRGFEDAAAAELRALQREVAAVALVYQRTQIGISVARLIPNREFRAVGKVR